MQIARSLPLHAVQPASTGNGKHTDVTSPASDRHLQRRQNFSSLDRAVFVKFQLGGRTFQSPTGPKVVQGQHPPALVGVKAIAAGNFRQIILKIANFEAKSEKIHVWHQ